jgi:predicted transcriptional regulator
VTASKSAIDENIRNIAQFLNKLLDISVWVSRVQQVSEVGQKFDSSSRKLMIETNFESIFKVGIYNFRRENSIGVAVQFSD